MQIEMSDDPPCEMKGSGMPVTGMRLIAMPMFTTSWKESIEKTPAATKVPNGSRDRNPIRSVATRSTTNSASRMTPPTKPRSSASPAKTKSDSAIGR